MQHELALQILKFIVPLSMLAVSVVAFLTIRKAVKTAVGKKDDLAAAVNSHYKKNREFTKKTKELSKIGVMFRTHNYALTPAYYLAMRLFVGILTAALAAFLTKKFIAIPIGIVAGYFLTHAYFLYENKVDNEEMIVDIYNTYANLKIQMSSGIYIRECLEYTYGMAKNERYKEALKEMVLNFSDRTVSSAESVKIFRDRFDSREIDKLSNLILSFLQYGINVAHADDIMSEIQSLIEAETLKAEHDIEMKAGVINFAFFSAIIAMVVYIVFSSFSTTGLF